MAWWHLTIGFGRDLVNIGRWVQNITLYFDATSPLVDLIADDSSALRCCLGPDSLLLCDV